MPQMSPMMWMIYPLIMMIMVMVVGVMIWNIEWSMNYINVEVEEKEDNKKW